MIATADNALLFLVKAFLILAMGVYVMRLLLQITHANFYNPISQVVYKLSQPAIQPLLRFVPRLRNFDTSAAIVLLLLALLYTWLIGALVGNVPGLAGLAWIAVLVVVSLVLKLYFLCLFAMALLSWVGPGVSNPAANVLWSLCDPLLRPVRRVLPLVSGIDLSPIPVMILLELFDRLLLPRLGIFNPGL
ncbi:MAG: YggT family protein [Nevskia sp.]|nr:YggT family protein [Nevskia sp.]